MSRASIQLVDAGWDRALTAAIRAYSSEVSIVCPFIKKRALNVSCRIGPMTFR